MPGVPGLCQVASHACDVPMMSGTVLLPNGAGTLHATRQDELSPKPLSKGNKGLVAGLAEMLAPSHTPAYEAPCALLTLGRAASPSSAAWGTNQHPPQGRGTPSTTCAVPNVPTCAVGAGRTGGCGSTIVLCPYLQPGHGTSQGDPGWLRGCAASPGPPALRAGRWGREEERKRKEKQLNTSSHRKGSGKGSGKLNRRLQAFFGKAPARPRCSPCCSITGPAAPWRGTVGPTRG